MAKVKDASTGSADAYDLRRSGRETPSRKETTSERTEKHPSPVRNKVGKIEIWIGSSPLRSSDRSKKLVEVSGLPNVKSSKEKTANSSKQSSEDVNEDKKTERQDPDVGCRKRKTFNAFRYKALFKPKRTRIESDVDKELNFQNSIRFQETPVKDHQVFLEGSLVDLDQKEHGDRPQTKSLDGNSSLSDSHTLHTSSYRHENDLQNQQELDICHKGEDVFEKTNRERDEKRASLENDYILDKSFIYVLYRNPSIRSEKLKILERKFAKKLEEHKRLWEIRLEELKATMLAAVGQVVAENEFSLHGSQHETRVVPSGNPEMLPALPKNPSEAQTHDEHVCEGASDIKSSSSDKEMVAATVSSEQIVEVPAHQLDDDMEVDVAEKVDSSHGSSKGGSSSPDASHAVEDHNENGANDMAPHVDSGGMVMPAGNYHKENDEDGTVGLDASHFVKDRPETVNDVAAEVESAEIGNAAGTCDKKSAEDGDTFPHTLDVGDDHNEPGPNDELPHVESAEMEIPVDKVNAEDSIIRPDALHANEDHNEFCGSDSGNPVFAPISQDKTPLVQPVSSSASNHEIQNDPLQLERLQDGGVQDEEINITNLQPSVASQLDQIIPDDEPESPSSTDPTVAENPSDTLPPSGPLTEPACEESLTVPESGETLEENLVAVAATPHEEQQSHLATSVAPTPPVNVLNMFDNLTHRVSPQMPNQTHPLQAEVERLYTVKDNVTKLHQEMKQKLNTEREKEIAEIVAQISLKYDAKHQEAEAAYNSKKKELEINIHRVVMNRVLAEAFRSQCQSPTPGHPVSQDELIQQLPRITVSPSMRIFHGQSSGNQQPPKRQPSLPQQQPQLQLPQPPLQIVHQPVALFSTTPSRLRPRPALLH